MFNYGLKLWSTNKNYYKEAVRLYEKNFYSYIELYVVPNSFSEYINLWQQITIPFVVHAPHYMAGLNFSKRENQSKNFELAGEAQKYADKLSAEWIIFHPGIDGDIAETAQQMKKLNEPRALVENKPYNAIGSNLICNGTMPEEIAMVMKEANVGFCFDIGHAVCAAKAYQREYLSFLLEFMKLNPVMFHLTDGDKDNVFDEHNHIGSGNYDFTKIINMLPHNAMITVETDKDSQENLDDFVADIEKLRILEKCLK